jgi:hypothetical protein
MNRHSLLPTAEPGADRTRLPDQRDLGEWDQPFDLPGDQGPYADADDDVRPALAEAEHQILADDDLEDDEEDLIEGVDLAPDEDDDAVDEVDSEDDDDDADEDDDDPGDDDDDDLDDDDDDDDDEEDEDEPEDAEK